MLSSLPFQLVEKHCQPLFTKRGLVCLFIHTGAWKGIQRQVSTLKSHATLRQFISSFLLFLLCRNNFHGASVCTRSSSLPAPVQQPRWCVRQDSFRRMQPYLCLFVVGRCLAAVLLFPRGLRDALWAHWGYTAGTSLPSVSFCPTDTPMML